MVTFHAFEQGLEIAFAKAVLVIALALDELEEDRADLRLRKDLHQQARFAALGRSVQQQAAGLQALNVFAMPWQALIQHFVIRRWRRGHEGHAALFQTVIAGIEIITDQRDVLDALTIVLAQEFLDLALAALAFLVQRNADLAVRRRQRLGGQAGILALDVEIADFLKLKSFS